MMLSNPEMRGKALAYPEVSSTDGVSTCVLLLCSSQLSASLQGALQLSLLAVASGKEEARETKNKSGWGITSNTLCLPILATPPLGGQSLEYQITLARPWKTDLKPRERIGWGTSQGCAGSLTSFPCGPRVALCCEAESTSLLWIFFPVQESLRLPSFKRGSVHFAYEKKVLVNIQVDKEVDWGKD